MRRNIIESLLANADADTITNVIIGQYIDGHKSRKSIFLADFEKLLRPLMHFIAARRKSLRISSLEDIAGIMSLERLEYLVTRNDWPEKLARQARRLLDAMVSMGYRPGCPEQKMFLNRLRYLYAYCNSPDSGRSR